MWMKVAQHSAVTTSDYAQKVSICKFRFSIYGVIKKKIHKEKVLEKSDLMSHWFYRNKRKSAGVIYKGEQGEKRDVTRPNKPPNVR
jgi:hypothetical protein